MSVQSILSDWQKRRFSPVYWLEGEESYFIDVVIDYAEKYILNESEAGFNLSVFYGKDADWTAVLNACRRYPMFSEKQVVILKEAQQMRDIDKLETYIKNPQPSTIFVVSHKEKKVDGRSTLSKIIKEKSVLVSTKKLTEGQLIEWTQEIIQTKGLTITKKGLALILDHIGNDLSRINNEIDKLALNLGARKNITEDDIENFIGISKEFNVFELQSAIISKDMAKAIRIIQYFEANPKAEPIHKILPVLYSFFAKVYAVHGLNGQDPKAFGLNLWPREDFALATRNYDINAVEKILILFHHYNLRSVGVKDGGTPEYSLLKELLVKIMG